MAYVWSDTFWNMSGTRVLSHQFLLRPLSASPAQDHTNCAYTFVTGKAYVGAGCKEPKVQAEHPHTYIKTAAMTAGNTASPLVFKAWP